MYGAHQNLLGQNLIYLQCERVYERMAIVVDNEQCTEQIIKQQQANSWNLSSCCLQQQKQLNKEREAMKNSLTNLC